MDALRGSLAATAIAFGAAAVSVYPDLPASQWVPDLLVGLAALALAAVTWPTRSVSALALLVALTWWAGTVWTPVLYLHRGVLVHLVLAVPRIGPRSRPAQVAVVVGYLAASGSLWASVVPALVATVGLVACAVIESRTRRGRGWHVVAPVLLAVAFVVGIVTPQVVGEEHGPLAALVAYDAMLLLVLGTVALRARSPSRAELTDLAVDLGRAPVRDVAALTALVRAEPGLATDSDLQQALAEARRLEAANEQVRDDVRRSILEVDRSRRRLVVAATRERARLARELDATAARPLHELIDRAARNGIRVPALTRAVHGVEATLSGLRPPGLDHGLVVALAGHPLVASLGVALDVPDERCDDVVEDALYAAAVESLTNVAKYAGPCRVAVRYVVDGDRVELRVSDNGTGGAAWGQGTGLAGLRDRLEALGGGLRITSPPGGGTVVTAWAPRALTGAGPRRLSGDGTPAEA